MTHTNEGLRHPGTDEIIPFPFATPGRVEVLLKMLGGEVTAEDIGELVHIERSANMQAYGN